MSTRKLLRVVGVLLLRTIIKDSFIVPYLPNREIPVSIGADYALPMICLVALVDPARDAMGEVKMLGVVRFYRRKIVQGVKPHLDLIISSFPIPFRLVVVVRVVLPFYAVFVFHDYVDANVQRAFILSSREVKDEERHRESC